MTGSNFFDTLQGSFVDVKIGEGDAIPTQDFLKAAESLTTLFDTLGSMAFKPVKSDMMGNIAKIRQRHDAKPADSTTLQSLVRSELSEKQHTATEGLVWLSRGLDFTSKALRQNVQNPKEELSASFRSAYSDTLKPHHSFVVKPIFSAAMSATPYRNDFYKRLGDDQDRVDRQLKEWLEALEKNVTILNNFLKGVKW